jgi:hypothetical protein
LERIERHESAIDIDYDGNEVEVEIDITFDEKRRLLINHFNKAYDKGLVSWPRGFQEAKKIVTI